MATVLYFAWVREKVGKSEEELELPSNVHTVADLLHHLRGQSSSHADALGDEKRLRVAVNQEHVDMNAPVGGDDEIAIFPPVTGG
ncbi:MAG: molybdopterin converting factor subunit 1 [Sphingomonadales bacterium]|nr:molybdopterin converting factor subunit 1 [Sphingomonadales bacterium]